MTDDFVDLLLESELNMDHGAWASCREAAVEIIRLRAEVKKLRDMLLRSDKLTRQEWYDMREAQLAEEANAAALKGTGDE